MKRAIRYTGLVSASVLLAGAALAALEKNEVEQRYEKKFLVVVREGLAVGTCAERQQGPAPLPVLTVKVRGEEAEFHTQSGASAFLSNCGAIVPEPLKKGEVLRVRGVSLHGHEVRIFVETVSLHQVDRARGASEHHSYQQGAADLRFVTANEDDATAITGLVEGWVKVFDSQDDAAKFGNTASGVFVKEVKLGMTFGEVESALGMPQTRVDLGEKVLYKYKDMTVEFRDGRVVDVR
jgi:hypothetical protein